MIETPRLILRPMGAADTDAFMQVFADPRVMAAFGEDPFDHRQTEEWVQRNLAHQDTYGYGLYTVILKADNAIVGDCGLIHMDIEGMPEVELGYDLQSAYWNRGLGTEAATAVRGYAFAVLKLPRLISLIREGNRASRRVAEKIGMRLETTLVRYGSRYGLYAGSPEEPASLPEEPSAKHDY
jgi:ribosomal-protein-alanine N-acetyltransferase